MSKHNSRKTRIRRLTVSKAPSKKSKFGLLVKKRSRSISDVRLQRGLQVLRERNDIEAAARSIRVSVKRFKKIALKKRAIRKRGKKWIVAGSLPRQILLFSVGSAIAITVPSIKSASLIGRYMAAVGQFLRTNKPAALAEFSSLGVKDFSGRVHPFETNPNILYQLASAGGEPFEDVYRIVI